ncbi:MAG: molybdopterin-binding protein [Sulfurimicrobium sp.]
MNTSAHNQFAGQVSAVKTGPVNAEVDLLLPGGETIVAVVTHASVDNLGLKPGVSAVALVKASWIILTAGGSDMKFSTRNRLCGKVSKVVKGMVNTEIMLKIAGGNELSAIITNESVTKLGLKEGVETCAIFKASSVIIGVKA